jgi:hypothetical protein
MSWMRTLSWILIAGAVAIIVGGLIYDGTKAGEDPNLAPLYMVGVVLALLAVGLGTLHRRGSSRH